ncbi:MAG: HAMP domain-containing protein [Silicimonas sp.]|nr:HAMP domain-containing protein [Silicimonas sp.]
MKCLVILVIACGVLAATLTILSDRSSRKIARIGIDALASNLTEVAATDISGSLKFRAVLPIVERMEEALGATGMSDTYYVLDSEGQVMTAQPESVDDALLTQMAELAAQALETGVNAASADGLIVATPILFGKDNAVIGSLAVVWNPGAIFAEIDASRRLQVLASIAVVLAMSGLAILAVRKVITTPLLQVNARTLLLSEGDLETPVPLTTRGDEIGVAAQALEILRDKLSSSEAAKRDAFLQSSGFQSTATAVLICDAELKITHANRAYRQFVQDNLECLRSMFPEIDPDIQVGETPDVFSSALAETQAVLSDLTYPYQTDILVGNTLIELTVTEITDDAGAVGGYVLEHLDVTEDRKNHALLDALEQAQVRADFDDSGALYHMNSRFLASLGVTSPPSVSFRNFLKSEDGTDVWAAMSEGRPLFGKFHVHHAGTDIILDGSLSPTKDRHDRTTGYVALGNDVTEAEHRLRDARAANEEMAAAQTTVVDALQEALTSLSQGDLKVRIDDALADDYEALRGNFNSAVTALDTAISEILDRSETILGEADNVSSAAGDLSHRTERQAATLEETAAAISELTASVASAASGAKQANDVVSEARANASASGEVVQQAVDAMGEISASSEQISRIIGVIDEIAFQTNLLALNAGVEAARAGDAGRGFAVVASEVRALAQRSSEAAREITDLISTSGDHVKKGVSLVDKAGHALTEIVGAVGGIAEHVSAIAASAREQSTGLEEINAAMSQLDQVTQKNVAMFEETMAASQTVTAEANSLVGITRRFECNRAIAETPNDANPGFETTRELHRDAALALTQDAIVKTSGNLALETEASLDPEWEEF